MILNEQKKKPKTKHVFIYFYDFVSFEKQKIPFKRVPKIKSKNFML